MQWVWQLVWMENPVSWRILKFLFSSDIFIYPLYAFAEEDNRQFGSLYLLSLGCFRLIKRNHTWAKGRDTWLEVYYDRIMYRCSYGYNIAGSIILNELYNESCLLQHPVCMSPVATLLRIRIAYETDGGIVEHPTFRFNGCNIIDVM